MEMLAQVTVLVQLRLLVAINSGATDVRLESCRYKCNVRGTATHAYIATSHFDISSAQHPVHF